MSHIDYTLFFLFH